MERITIITPTIGRSTLKRAVSSVREQRFRQWQHIIVLDGDFDLDFRDKWKDKKTDVIFTGKRSGNPGNTARHIAWDFIDTDYVMYLDDDNYLIDGIALGKIVRSLRLNNWPNWAVFPLKRYGEYFMNNPAGNTRTDVGQVVHKKEVRGVPLRFPNSDIGHADGLWVEDLVKAFGQPAFLNCGEMVVYEEMNRGKFF